MSDIKPFAPWPYFGAEEQTAATRVLASGKVNYWTGTEAREFEKEFAAFVGTKYAIAVSNGTVSLDMALHALQIPAGSEMIVTSRTFVASVSPAVIRGIKPVFADVDPVSQNITAETIKPFINEKTKVILAVHLGGWACPMDEIMALANQHDIKVIEDCAQSHGSMYKGKPVGAWGHINSFSFCQDKQMTTAGEGGMITTDDPELWQRAWSFKDHGKSYDAVYNRQHPPGFRWLHESFGTNYRMTEIQAAIGRVLLRKLPEWNNQRRAFAHEMNAHFASVSGLRVTIPSEDEYHTYYKYYVFVRPEQLKEGWNRDRIMVEVSKHGIPCFSGSCSEIYLEKAFEQDDLRPQTRLTIAQELGETALMFLVHPTLDMEDIHNTIRAVKNVMAEAAL